MDSVPRTPEEHRVWWEVTYPGIPYGDCVCGCGEKTKPAHSTNAGVRSVRGCPQCFVGKGHAFLVPRKRWRVMNRGYDTPCWMWQGSVSKNGYGVIYVRGTYKNAFAHRFFYEEAHGPVDPGLHMDHLCRNRSCVNPDHLEPVTPAENKRRGAGIKLSKGRAADIRYLYATERYSRRWLALAYGVSRASIDLVVTGDTWVGD